MKRPLLCVSTLSIGQTLWFVAAPMAHASDKINGNAVYEVGELFELGIQLSYLLLLLGFLGVGTFFVIRQVLVRRELDLSAKELQVTSISYLHALMVIDITFGNDQDELFRERRKKVIPNLILCYLNSLCSYLF